MFSAQKKFLQKQPYYPCASVISATSMLTICRREESIRLLVRWYSLMIRSPPDFLVSANSTTCEVDTLFTTDNTLKKLINKVKSQSNTFPTPTYTFGLFICSLSLSGWTITLLQKDCVIRVAGHDFKDDCGITTTSRQCTGICFLGTAGQGFIDICSSGERDRTEQNTHLFCFFVSIKKLSSSLYFMDYSEQLYRHQT